MMGRGRALNAVTALLLSLLLAIVPLAQAQEPIYKAGDWITYRMSIKGSYMGQTVDCVVSARVSIVSVEYDELTYVTYKVEDIKVEKGGNECLQYSRNYVREYETVNIKYVKPESGQIFIDPSYTGEHEYQLGMAKIKVSYYKGVLTKYTLNAEYEVLVGLKYEMRASIELVDTSISELKPKAAAAFPWIVLLIVIPVVVVVTVVVVVLLRRRAKAVGATPVQPPAQQPPQVGAPAGSTT